ncbi:PKD domain-containing protein [Lutibacter sp. A64]|uniref:PKD domain-containing protein n=1 Tax=Lutibacter sp. A64 TaxID=2918526 RepID=UPI001F05C95C|nr:PKD domain-containing protein [Lutibacter sp. A64]UMB55039.1 PKD domain-containing protein [Lutibacter sp. A64]
MKSHHLLTVLKGFFFSFILFSFILACSKKDEIEEIPVAAFSFTPATPEAGTEVSFTNQSTDADSYQWSAEGISFSSTEEHPKFTFETAGDYEVKLVATNSAGSDEIIKTITVTAAQEAPVAAFSFTPATPEAGTEVSFTNQSTDADSYQWSAEGISFSSTEEHPKFTFETAGDYEVKLVATNSAGSDEIIKTITVTAAQEAPVAAFSFTPATPEAGTEVSFTNQSTDADSYQWSAEGISFSSTEEHPKFTFETAGDYEVKLVATNSAGSDEIIKTITVTAAQEAPVAAFSFTPATPEAGTEVSFTNQSTDADSYQWSAEGISFSSTEEHPKFTFETAGDYEVKLVATNSAGSDEIIKTITVTAAQEAPVAAFSFTPATPEAGTEVSFTNESTDADSYQWSAEGISFSSTEEHPKFTFETAGDYEVKLVVTNSAGSDEIIKTITVTAAQEAPVAAFSFTPATPEAGTEVSFTNESTDADSYQWSAEGTSFSSTEEHPKFTFETAGDYEVKLVATNSAGSDEIIKTITVINGGGSGNSCNLPECYVEKTTTVSSGVTTTVTYGYTVISGSKKLSSITTSTGYGNLVTSFQYDVQGRRIKSESKLGGSLQNYTEYNYNNDQTVKANTYDSSGTLTGYSIDKYDANNRLTRTDIYSSDGKLGSYVVYSDFLSTEESFPQLVQTYDSSNAITQTDTHTYQDCQLKKTVSKDGSGTVIGEINNTIDASGLLRTSSATIYTQGFTITSNTDYVYDCD